MFDRPIRCALVGLGRFGANYGRILPSIPDLALSAVCDPSSAARARAGAGPRVVADVSELDLTQLDAAIIAAPTPTHGPLTLAALHAGLHVLVEKPLAQTAAEASAIVVAAAERERVVLAGQLTLHHPGVQRLRALVGEGALGPIVRVVATRTSSGALHRTEPQRAHPNEPALSSLGPHDVANVLHVLGEDAPLRVDRASQATLDEAELRASSGAIDIHMRWSRRATRAHRALLVVGQKGEAELDEVAGRLRVRLRSSTHVEELAPPRPLLDEQLRHFAACVRGSEFPRPRLADAARVVTILHEAARLAEAQDRDAHQSRALSPA